MNLHRLARAAAVVLAASLLSVLTPARATAQNLREKLIVHDLPNGLRILIYPRTESPTFAGVVSVDVGGSDEVYGQTGVAHMFEHMAFKGTRVIGTTDYAAEEPIMQAMDVAAAEMRDELSRSAPDPARIQALRDKIRELQAQQAQFIRKDEFDEIAALNGGNGLNASTSADSTNYYIEFPANRLELFFWLEAQRLKDPVMREFYSERDVVLEERKQRTDNSAFGKLYEAFLTAAFEAHPYGKPTIGWYSEISSITRPMAEDFRLRFYGPKSTVIAIVGDVDPYQVKTLANRYLADWDAPGKPQRLVTHEPPPRGEKRIKVEFPAQPSLMIGWHKPGPPHADDAAFSVLSEILSGGRTGRLYRKLVLDEQIVTDIGAFDTPGEKYDNLFAISATPKGGKAITDVEASIYAVLADVAANGVTDEELATAKRQFQASYVRAARSNLGFASTLARTANIFKDPYAIEASLVATGKVTSDDIKRVVSTYLTTTNRTVAWIETVAPDKAPARAGRPVAMPRTPGGPGGQPPAVPASN